MLKDNLGVVKAGVKVVKTVAKGAVAVGKKVVGGVKHLVGGHKLADAKDNFSIGGSFMGVGVGMKFDDNSLTCDS
jgi:hypothetical protein